jgi:hypothetical protein
MMSRDIPILEHYSSSPEMRTLERKRCLMVSKRTRPVSQLCPPPMKPLRLPSASSYNQCQNEVFQPNPMLGKTNQCKGASLTYVLLANGYTGCWRVKVGRDCGACDRAAGERQLPRDLGLQTGEGGGMRVHVNLGRPAGFWPSFLWSGYYNPVSEDMLPTRLL